MDGAAARLPRQRTTDRPDMQTYNRFAGFRLCGHWPSVLSAYDRGVCDAWAAFWGNRIDLMADARLAAPRRA